MTGKGIFGLLATALLAACQPAAPPDRSEDRAAIHRLLVDYGRTLDARDFDGFAALFARDGVYVAGGSGQPLSGSEAGEAMRRTFAENALGFADPNYHLFFNETIDFTGPDEARSTSQSLYMVPDERGAPRAAMMASYDDRLVRQAGHWKFARRVVHAQMPAPPGR